MQAEELAGIPRWRGEPLQGKSLLVWTEQGLGDSIMMLRYLPLLEGNGAKRLIARCEPPLLRLFERAAGAWRVVPRDAPLVHEEIDLHCPMMSLPHAFARRGDAIARNVPYVSVPEPLGRSWRNQLGEVAGLRVGLAWAGGAAFVGGAQRDIALERLAPLFDVAGARLVSLQKGPASAEIERSRLRLFDRMRDCRDLLDTAALIDQLDLVISVDTAVAHLAGALGKPVWLLNRLDSDWRWMREREDSPWYPTMRIFRQARRGEWDGVILDAAAALRRLAESRPSG